MTKYEALVYIALLRVPNATAGEIHGSSSVPRASVSPVLDQLLEKDLVSVSRSAPKRFAALPPDEAVARLLGRIERNAATAQEALPVIHRRKLSPEQGNEELIWNLYGALIIRRRLAEIIAGAEREIRMIALPDILTPEVKAAFAAVSDRVRAEVITPCWDGPLSENLKVHGRKYREMPGKPGMAKDLMAGGISIFDRKKVLTIVGSGDAGMVALFSASEGFVRFFLRYSTLIAGRAERKRP